MAAWDKHIPTLSKGSSKLCNLSQKFKKIWRSLPQVTTSCWSGHDWPFTFSPIFLSKIFTISWITLVTRHVIIMYVKRVFAERCVVLRVLFVSFRFSVSTKITCQWNLKLNHHQQRYWNSVKSRLYLQSKMLDHKKQLGKQRLLIVSMKAGEGNLFSRGRSVGVLLLPILLIMKSMKCSWDSSSLRKYKLFVTNHIGQFLLHSEIILVLSTQANLCSK